MVEAFWRRDGRSWPSSGGPADDPGLSYGLATGTGCETPSCGLATLARAGSAPVTYAIVPVAGLGL
jgi:hypothetical protein